MQVSGESARAYEQYNIYNMINAAWHHETQTLTDRLLFLG
jgi:hypothetical protein